MIEHGALHFHHGAVGAGAVGRAREQFQLALRVVEDGFGALGRGAGHEQHVALHQLEHGEQQTHAHQ